MKKHYFIIFILFSCSVFSDDPPPRESLIKKEYIYLASILKPDSLRDYPTTVFLGKLKPNGYPPKLISSNDEELYTQMQVLRNYYSLEIAQQDLGFKVFLKTERDSIELKYIGNGYYQDLGNEFKIKPLKYYSIVAYKNNESIKGTTRVPENIILLDYKYPFKEINYKNDLSDTLTCKIMNDNFNDLYWGTSFSAKKDPLAFFYRNDYYCNYGDVKPLKLLFMESGHKFSSTYYLFTTFYKLGRFTEQNLLKANLNYFIYLSSVDSNYANFYTGSKFGFASTKTFSNWHGQFDPFNGYDIKNRSSLKTNNPDVIGFVGSINSKNFTFVTKVDTNVTEIIEYQREE